MGSHAPSCNGRQHSEYRRCPSQGQLPVVGRARSRRFFIAAFIAERAVERALGAAAGALNRGLEEERGVREARDDQGGLVETMLLHELARQFGQGTGSQGALRSAITKHRHDIETPEERVERVRELTAGRGADVTIEATGSPAAIGEGLRMTRDAGRYVVAGQYTDAGETTIHPHEMINRKHLDVRGVWGAGYDHFRRMVDVLGRHGDRIGWERTIGRQYGLDEMNEALADVEAGRVVKAVVAPND